MRFLQLRAVGVGCVGLHVLRGHHIYEIQQL